MFLDHIAPAEFCCKYQLKTGAMAVGIIMCGVTFGCIAGSASQLATMKKYSPKTEMVSPYVRRNFYALTITASIYSIIMLLFNFVFIWGVAKKIPSVIFTWLVVTSMWYSQLACLLISLLCIYSKEVGETVWIVCLIFGLIAIAIMSYFLLIAYSYGRQLKKEKMARLLRLARENAITSN